MAQYCAPWLNAVHPWLIDVHQASVWLNAVHQASIWHNAVHHGINYSSMLCVRHQCGCASCINNAVYHATVKTFGLLTGTWLPQLQFRAIWCYDAYAGAVQWVPKTLCIYEAISLTVMQLLLMDLEPSCYYRKPHNTWAFIGGHTRLLHTCTCKVLMIPYWAHYWVSVIWTPNSFQTWPLDCSHPSYIRWP